MIINGIEFFTVREMAKLSKRSVAAVKQFMYREKYNPVCKDALYTVEAYEALINSPGSGRPKKPAEPEPKKAKGKK